MRQVFYIVTVDCSGKLCQSFSIQHSGAQRMGFFSGRVTFVRYTPGTELRAAAARPAAEHRAVGNIHSE